MHANICPSTLRVAASTPTPTHPPYHNVKYDAFSAGCDLEDSDSLDDLAVRDVVGPLAKMDTNKGCRQFSVEIHLAPVFGYAFRHFVVVDRCLQFGCTSSPSFCRMCAAAVEYAHNNTTSRVCCHTGCYENEMFIAKILPFYCLLSNFPRERLRIRCAVPEKIAALIGRCVEYPPVLTFGLRLKFPVGARFAYFHERTDEKHLWRAVPRRKNSNADTSEQV